MGMRLVEACGGDAYQPGFALHLGHGLAAVISEGGSEATGVRGEYFLGPAGEQVERLKQGVAAWNKWREHHPDKGINLCRANLSKAHLRGADLRDACLGWANLGGANLYRANLVKANLYKANLTDADLSEANLRGADLTDARGIEMGAARDKEG